MPSFTFSSETSESRSPTAAPGPGGVKSGMITLLGGLVVIFFVLEVSSPRILARFSRTERRINTELNAANSLRPSTADDRPTVLLVGNSLLLEGVQVDSLRAALAPQYEVSRLAIEQTHYLDWYFGLRRLLESGSRPSVIVLSLATDQLASPFTLGESFAHRQLSVRDFPKVVREAKLDRTTASTYFFAHWSEWQADKGFIRQCVMITLIPNFRELAAHIADHGAHLNDPKVLLATTRQRLPELAELSRTYHVRIVLLIPPTLHEDHSGEIQEIGEAAGVPVWVLSLPGEFTSNYFNKDRFHLNPLGSGIFTTRLSQKIRAMQDPRVWCNNCEVMSDGAEYGARQEKIRMRNGVH